MVNVKQGALRAFKQQIRTGFVDIIELARHIGHHGLELLCVADGLRVSGIKVDGWRVQISRQHMVVQLQQLPQLGGKTLWMFEVLHAQGTPGNLVFVSRANAFAGSTDFFSAALLAQGFTGRVECGMERQNQRTGFTDAQARPNLNTL